MKTTNKTLSLQQIFNRAVKGLAGQDWKRSTNQLGGCLYRGTKINEESGLFEYSGLKCAIGHCLTDEELEARGVPYEGSLMSLPPDAKKRLGIHIAGRSDALIALQVAHDKALSPSDMRTGLKQFAANFELVRPKELK